MSIQRRFDEDLAELKQQILRMGSLVEDQIRQALKAMIDRDDGLATQVIDNDRQVNTIDVAVDEACLELLALQQPAARDLRFITTAMKISTELERMSDLAENEAFEPGTPETAVTPFTVTLASTSSVAASTSTEAVRNPTVAV